ncbi:MAG: biotin--[acetyl-CoA-carboxylase] ligase [Candidatus Aminicenantes bacterium]|nr:biotin--[acetyl-CoA-carboxylase] ligase [Candidatus Aminicenantes bacterium]
MIVYSDSERLLNRYFGDSAIRESGTDESVTREMNELHSLIFDGRPYFKGKVEGQRFWHLAFLVEEARMSQYDLLIERARQGGSIPDRMICLADSGESFHGQRERPWAALKGNIHLSVHLIPGCPVPHFGTGFSILAAVALIEAVDGLPGFRGRAGIKWVNDIWLDGAKIAGFLAYTQSMEQNVDRAILGIGLNVETSPNIESDVFVPRASSLRDRAGSGKSPPIAAVIDGLLQALERNYSSLLAGRYDELLYFYKKRCLVIGRKITLFSDSPGLDPQEIVSGTVSAIGPNLELYLKGHSNPFTSGRLVLLP